MVKVDPAVAQFLRALMEHQVELVVHVPDAYGYMDVYVDVDQIHEFLADPEGYAADKVWGVSKSDYLEWLDSSRSVQCSALTRSKKPCKQVVRGGVQVTPTQWVELRGSYCAIHEDKH